jgi:hypothetical protein
MLWNSAIIRIYLPRCNGTSRSANDDGMVGSAQEKKSVSRARVSRRHDLRLLLVLGVLAFACANAQVNVTTQLNDIGRTGQNLNETILNTGNVNTTQFGLLFARSVDGYMYAQPLYLSGVSIAGVAHNVVYLATEHDSVYAFDADSNTGADATPLWQASMLAASHGAASGATTVPTPPGSAIVPELGITGTPVIDPASGTLYLVSASLESGNHVQRLHALDATSGAEKFGGPVQIAAGVAGTGVDNVSGTIAFNAKQENQRPGLLLLNGIVYIAWASHGDLNPWHGWIIGYNAATLQQSGAFCASPDGDAAGIWMSGAGLAADVVDPVNHPYGRIFVATGNGDYTAARPYTNAMDYGDSVIDLDLTGGVPTVTDEFTPLNQAADDKADTDVGSGGVMILPTQSIGPNPHLLVQAGKPGVLYLLNRDNLGGYNTTGDQVVEEIPKAVGDLGVWSSPAYWNGNVYYWGQYDHLKSFPLAGGALAATPTKSTEEYGFPGATPAISANGSTQGIVWTIDTEAYGTEGPAILQAHDASNVATMLYSSATNAARDTAGPANKFAVPTITNGKVYVGTAYQLDVYGLLGGQTQTSAPSMSPAAESFIGSVVVTISDSTSSASIFYTLDGSTPSTASTPYTGPITVASSETINAIATAPGLTQSVPASASYTQTPAATPVFSLPFGTYTAVQSVLITASTPGSTIHYTTDGSTPTGSSPQYSGPLTVSSSETLQAIAVAAGYSTSNVESVPYTISGTATDVLNDPGGFTGTAGFALVGSPTLSNGAFELTDGGANEARAVWFATPVNIQNFATQFEFLQTAATADGFTFTLQNSTAGVKAIGTGGRGLGYKGITPSIAVKFDLQNAAGQADNSTGFYTDGALPTVPELDMTSSGINLHSGDILDAQISYNGTTLTLVLTDTVTRATFTASTNIDIPALLGANTAYIGFTASTGNMTSIQYLLNWTYQVNSGIAAAQTPYFAPAAGTYSGEQMVSIGDTTAGAAIYYTTDGTTPTTASTLYTGPVTVNSSETINVIAVASGYAASAVGTAAYTISFPSQVSFPAGFTSASGLNLNGATVANGTLQLTTAAVNEARAAWWGTPVNVQSFSTDFLFQDTAANAGGFTFTIQNAGPGVVGATGEGLGYFGLGSSVAIKFDPYNNSGEGPDSTGFYTDGVEPTVPALDMRSSGVNLHSTDVLHAHITYDGTTLALILTDTVTNDSFTASTAIDIPAIVGGNTAYVGFTASTGTKLSVVQTILDWTYTAGIVVTPPAATPVFSPAAGAYTGAQSVTISAATPGSTIYCTTDGTTPTTASAICSGPVIQSSSGILKAIAVASGNAASPLGSAAYTINGVAPAQVNFPNGFTSAGALDLIGATITGGALQLTDGAIREARAAWYALPVNVQKFTTDFLFQETSAIADGFTFTIQNAGPGAVGAGGYGLGYYGIGPSVAIKFDLYSNNGEGPDSTGFYTGGAAPTVPALDLRAAEIFLHSSDILHAHITYDGTTLSLTLTDTVTGASFTAAKALNIPAVVAGDLAYVGFTASSDATSSAVQNIRNWTYSSGAVVTGPAATPAFSPAAGAYTGSQSVTISAATPGSTIYYTTDGTMPGTAAAIYVNPVTVNTSGIISAIAVASGHAASPMGSAAYTMNGIAPPQVSFPNGFASAGALYLIGATITGGVLQLTDGATGEARAAWYADPVNVQDFTTDFDFQETSANADGFTFTLQNAGPGAVGLGGYGLGYAGIGSSVAIKFDLYSDRGEGTDSTGFYTDGAAPTAPALDMSSSGVNLHSPDVLHAHITYAGTSLLLTLTDTVTGATFTASTTINIPSVVGGDLAYVGFTASTNATLSAIQNITNWTYVVSP